MFQAAYNSKKPTPDLIKKALAAYVRSLVTMNSPFDQYMRGNAAAMTAQQVKGFNFFMGKAKCGTCHFMPLPIAVNKGIASTGATFGAYLLIS